MEEAFADKYKHTNRGERHKVNCSDIENQRTAFSLPRTIARNGLIDVIPISNDKPFFGGKAA